MIHKIHLAESFNIYEVVFFCGERHIDFRNFYLDPNRDADYTSTTSKATCKECLEKANQ